ncbi:ABC transporter substrate-binding protein [Pseudoalteromonas sp. bablab_jr011]|uniref:ABC transporter substrate-binding protein n=1 Tax=Pseudoalteromonas sp. bablab_jr011 TaxID=2755062 RepID=UPI0018F6EFFA|nr:ABC transporter substrate-binding protein [Pseudoalteromonas sp. bablab_jr011]
MRKHLKKAFYVISSLLLGSYVHASEQLSITWLENDSGPFYIEKNETTPHAGLCNEITDLLITALPHIKHTKVTIPQKRANKYLDEGHMACYACMIHREQKTHRVTYSIPTTVYPPFTVLSNSEQAEKIYKAHGNPVSLISLLTDAHFMYGQNDARKFGNPLDNIAKNIKLYDYAALSSTGSQASYALLTQLEHGYIDYTIDYPFVADYYNNKYQQDIKKLAIGDPEQHVVLGAIGCSTSAPNNYAQRVLVDINNALKNTVLPSEKYQQNQRAWLEESFPDFLNYYQRFILAPLKSPAIDGLELE